MSDFKEFTPEERKNYEESFISMIKRGNADVTSACLMLRPDDIKLYQQAFGKPGVKTEYVGRFVEVRFIFDTSNEPSNS